MDMERIREMKELREDGFTIAEIAEEFSMPERTVSDQLKKIYGPDRFDKIIDDQWAIARKSCRFFLEDLQREFLDPRTVGTLHFNGVPTMSRLALMVSRHDPEPQPIADQDRELKVWETFSFLSKSDLQGVGARSIAKCVAANYDITFEELIGSRRKDWTVWARQEAVWLIWALCNLTLPQIGRIIGNRDHTTIIHSVKKMSEEYGLEYQKSGKVVRHAYYRLSEIRWRLRSFQE